MPLYLYECDSCGKQKDEVHGMTDNPNIKCDSCGEKCFKVIQPVQGFVRGNCYNNKADCKKAATLSTLQEADPYARHRVPGETEDLINKIKNKDKNSKSYAVNGTKKSKSKKSK
jgi:putative FmdB family regulatory protein